MYRHLLILILLLCPVTLAAAEPFHLTLRYQVETAHQSGRYHRLTRSESWQPEQTAIIVCDVWDSHTCENAVLRLNQFVPRLNELLTTARQQGATIIHAPSGCMDFYADHPARRRAMEIPTAEKLPEEITSWCYQIPSEERGTYPLEQDDANDDSPEQKERWLAQLLKEERNPKRPWIREHPGVHIDETRDFISDKGDEVWSILEDAGIQNVLLCGVHTNMCVLGRPFGLRQMVQNGKNTALIRDLTDTMYNPAQKPYVSHFTGTDLILAHIEQHVCPTITSDQFLGRTTFHFKNDHRPHLVMVIADDEYRTEETLPAFALSELGHSFRVSYVFGSEQERHLLPGLEMIEQADVVLFSVRRRVLPAEQMQLVREFIAAGKPVLGVRTASHAFYIKQEPPAGYADWQFFDPDVFGGNYHGHYGNKLKSTITIADIPHPVLSKIDSKQAFPQGASLYQVLPLEAGTTPLLFGTIEGEPSQPVAWTFLRKDGGRSFYTSLGNVDDFQQPQFRSLLKNGLLWAVGNRKPTSAQ